MAGGSEDFALRLQGYAPTLVNVIYYLPDYPSILNEFIWQTMDVAPRYPRVSAFLDHWRRDIDAVVKDVLVSSGQNFSSSRYARVTGFFRF